MPVQARRGFSFRRPERGKKTTVSGFLVKSAVSMLVLAGLLYGTFFVPIGRFTLYGHLSRVAGTDEAQELAGEVTGAVEGAGRSVASRFGNPDAPPGD